MKLDTVEDLELLEVYHFGALYDTLINLLKNGKSNINGLQSIIFLKSNRKLSLSFLEDNKGTITFECGDAVKLDLMRYLDMKLITRYASDSIKVNVTLDNINYVFKFTNFVFDTITYERNRKSTYSDGIYEISDGEYFDAKTFSANHIFNVDKLIIEYRKPQYREDSAIVSFVEPLNNNIVAIKNIINNNQFKFNGTKFELIITHRQIGLQFGIKKDFGDFIKNIIQSELNDSQLAFKEILEIFYFNKNNWNTHNSPIDITFNFGLPITIPLGTFLYGFDIKSIIKNYPDINRDILMKLVNLLTK